VVNTFRQTFPETPVTLLDSGNFSDAPSPTGALKTRALLRAMRDLGYAAVNVGERDVRFGYDQFARTVEGSGLAFVSSNIVDQQSGKPIFPTHVVINASSPDEKHKLRIGVIGAVRFNPIFLQPGPNGGEMTIKHPKERVEGAVQALRQEKEAVDLVVLLAAMHRDDARRVAQDVAGIDFVIGSYGGVFSTEQESSGGSWIFYSGNQGKRIGETRIFLGEPREMVDQSTTLHLMTSIYPADPIMLEFVNSLRLPQEAPEQSGDTVVGPAPATPGGP